MNLILAGESIWIWVLMAVVFLALLVRLLPVRRRNNELEK